MNTIQIYQRVSDTKVIERTKSVCMSEQKRIFERYAKTYRAAYGCWPTAHSLSIEAKEYGGVSIETLNRWLEGVKKAYA